MDAKSSEEPRTGETVESLPASFPQGEEILIGSTGFVGLALRCVGAGEAEMGECEERIVRDHGGMVEKFLELCCCVSTLMEKQIRLPANVHGIKKSPNSQLDRVANSYGAVALRNSMALEGLLRLISMAARTVGNQY